MKSLNILFVGRVEFPDGMGETRRFYDIFGRLNDIGHRLELVNVDMEPPQDVLDAIMRFSWRHDEEVVMNVKVHTINREFTLFFQPILTMLYLNRVIKSRDIDIMVLGVPDPFTALPALLSKWFTGTPLVVDYPDSHYIATEDGKLSIFGRIGEFTEQVLPKYADAVFPISYTMDRELLHEIPETKRHVIRPGIRFDMIAGGVEDRELVPDGFTIGYVGTYADREGVADLVNAVDIVRDDIEEIRLVLVGGLKRQNSDLIDRLASNTELSEYITEIEYIDHDHLPDFLASCDVLCAPQRETFAHRVAFSTKVCEFLASGTPLITTPIGDLEGLLEDRVHAVMVNTESPAEIADAIKTLYDEPQLRERVGKNGQLLAKEEFNADHQRRQVEKILKEICDTN